MFDFLKRLNRYDNYTKNEIKKEVVVEKEEDRDEAIYTKNNPQYVSNNHKYDALVYHGLNTPNNARINPKNIGKEYVFLEKGIDFCKHTPSNIKHIVFADIPYPKVFDAWDVSEAKDESVVAWVDKDTMFVSSGVKGVKINTHENASCMFYARGDLQSIDFDNLTTIGCDNMTSMFEGCKMLRSLDLSNFNTKYVVGMSAMFGACDFLRYLNISNFDTSSVKDMSMMFGACRNLRVIDISHFNTDSLINGRGMFDSCLKLHTVSLGEMHFNKPDVPEEMLFAYKNQMVNDSIFRNTPALSTLVAKDDFIINQFNNPDELSLQGRKAMRVDEFNPKTTYRKLQVDVKMEKSTDVER